jgi:hypothetical protein
MQGHLWAGGGLYVIAVRESGHSLIDITWKRTPPSIVELRQLAAHFFPTGHYVMRIIDGDTIRMWSSVEEEDQHPDESRDGGDDQGDQRDRTELPDDFIGPKESERFDRKGPSPSQEDSGTAR